MQTNRPKKPPGTLRPAGLAAGGQVPPGQRRRPRGTPLNRGFRLALLCLPLLAATPASGADAGFVHREGEGLVVGTEGKPVRLRGVNFQNDCWADGDFIVQHSLDHSETDYARVAQMGMNVIRFMLTYRLFEDDAEPYTYKPEGWAWLDREIGFAKARGLYLVLDMQIPQGVAPDGDKSGMWSTENLARLKALWRAIAERYRDETTIAAYDLVNEPWVPVGPEQWTALANQLIDEIRAVDPNHLVLVQNAHGNADFPLSLVDDPNVLYDVHIYTPHAYSHQYNPHQRYGDGGAYPDPLAPVLLGDYSYFAATHTTPVPAGDSGWASYETGLYQVADPLVVWAETVFACGRNEGSVCFDDFQVYEFDPGQNLVRMVHHIDPDHPVEEIWTYTGIEPFQSFADHWSSWHPEGESGVWGEAAEGHWGGYAFSISQTTGSFNLHNWRLGFPVKQGYLYKISGWMKGEGVTHESCTLGLEFYRASSSADFQPFDQGYLESHLCQSLVDFGQANGVPLNVGEFGLMSWCFRSGVGGLAGNKGGIAWVDDWMRLFDQYGVHYQYFGYHSTDFGLYQNAEGLPDPAAANQALITHFKQRLLRKGLGPVLLLLE